MKFNPMGMGGLGGVQNADPVCFCMIGGVGYGGGCVCIVGGPGKGNGCVCIIGGSGSG